MITQRIVRFEMSIAQSKMQEFNEILTEQQSIILPANRLQIDLHCHDYNSNEPDELWGRILNLPETWLTTEDLIKNLKQKNCRALTITNHNNARSCWKLLDKGIDILASAEFTCTFPELDVKIHVLTYGFTPAQEEILNRLRHNIYKFQAYTAQCSLPTVLPHPLYFYSSNSTPSMELFHKMMILFERFEVLNGQRDLNQNLLTAKWVSEVNQEKIEEWEKTYGIVAKDYCIQPYIKKMTGGSDDHMGFFAGSSGTYIDIPELDEKLKIYKPSELALHGLLHGNIAPYGWANGGEKLSAAFLDYFFQVAMRMKDPGLLRILLHRGSIQDKLSCATIANALFELRRHKHTMVFIKSFHQALKGVAPSLGLYIAASKKTRPILKEIKYIAKAKNQDAETFSKTLDVRLGNIFVQLNSLFIDRVQQQNVIPKLTSNPKQNWLSYMELPSHLRSLFADGQDDSLKQSGNDKLSIKFDQLSFPMLATVVLGGAVFAGHRVLNKNRKFINQFRAANGWQAEKERVLWLTDSFFDANGVSTALKDVYTEVVSRKLPIDFCTIHPTEAHQENLIVLKPVASWDLPNFSNHSVRMPNVLELFKVMEKGGYTKIVCSTELALGPIALLLSSAFSVPVTFFMHTDWMEYFNQNLHWDTASQNRLRRILRTFYNQFDQIWVLNKEHQNWLSSKAMNIPSQKIRLTSHWPAPIFNSKIPKGMISDQNMILDKRSFSLLFVGRLSEEKGLKDFVRVVNLVKKSIPDVHAMVAGKGPLQEWLNSENSSIQQLGWLSQEQLKLTYQSADLLVFPSRFDTFGCTVIESMACGTPVVAYGIKGPLDIIEHKQSGWLVSNLNDMANTIISVANNRTLLADAKLGAIKRAEYYSADRIIKDLIGYLEIDHQMIEEYHFESDSIDTAKEIKTSTLWEDLFSLVTEGTEN